MMSPLAERSCASPLGSKPTESARSSMPVACVHRNGTRSIPPVTRRQRPTTTCPPAETARAVLRGEPGPRSPSPIIPSDSVQRNASVELASSEERLWPTTAEPSRETPRAMLLNGPPGRSPRPMKVGSSPARAAIDTPKLARRSVLAVQAGSERSMVDLSADDAINPSQFVSSLNRRRRRR